MLITVLTLIFIALLFAMGKLVYGRGIKTLSFIRVFLNFVGMMAASGIILSITLALLVVAGSFVYAHIPGVPQISFELVEEGASEEQGSEPVTKEQPAQPEQTTQSEQAAQSEQSAQTPAVVQTSAAHGSQTSETHGASAHTSAQQTIQLGGKFQTVAFGLTLLILIFIVAIVHVAIRRVVIERIGFLRLTQEEHEISEYFIQWMTIYVVVYQLLFDALKSIGNILPQITDWQDAFEVILSPQNINAVSQPLLIAMWIAIVLEKLAQKHQASRAQESVPNPEA